MKTFLLCILLGACGDTQPDPSPGTSKLAATEVPSCTVLGANDGLDDTAAVTAALASGCGCVQLTGGTYDFPVEARPRNAAHVDTLTLGNNQCLRGEGRATVLRFTGNAQAYDLVGIAMTGTGPRLEDLVIDTTGLINVQEQTHAVQVDGPSPSPVIRGVTFVHAPTAGTSTGGDCIKLVGFASTGKKITNPLITDSMFASCPRSAVNVHSGVYGLVFSNSLVFGAAKVDFDSEENNGDSDQWSLSGLTFLKGAGDGEIAVSITAAPHVSITGTVIIGKGVYIASATQTVLAGDIVVKTVHPVAAGGMASVRIFSRSSDVVISGSYLGRAAGTVVAPVLETMADDNGGDLTRVVNASHITVTGSRLSQGTTAVVARFESTTDYKFVANDIDCAGCSIGIDVQGIAHRADRGTIALNTVIGQTLAAVRLTGANKGVGRTSVIGNMAEGSTQGLRCENVVLVGGGIIGPTVSSGNNWPANAAACVTTLGN